MRWGIVSDIHGNLPALRAVLDELRRFGAERHACLGDLVGYGPHPNEVVCVVRELDPVIVAGNHDQAVTGRLPLDWFAAVPRACLQWTIARLHADARDYLRRLPDTADLTGVRLTHALPPDSATTYLTDDALAELAGATGRWPERLCLVGHTHRPQCVTLVVGELATDLVLRPLPTHWKQPQGQTRAVVNVGSSGQPRDGDWRAFCALWDDERRTLETRRVPYDVEAVVADMAAAGLPDDPARRLLRGI